jgi:hypothetical protein
MCCFELLVKNPTVSWDISISVLRGKLQMAIRHAPVFKHSGDATAGPGRPAGCLGWRAVLTAATVLPVRRYLRLAVTDGNRPYHALYCTQQPRLVAPTWISHSVRPVPRNLKVCFRATFARHWVCTVCTNLQDVLTVYMGVHQVRFTLARSTHSMHSVHRVHRVCSHCTFFL